LVIHRLQKFLVDALDAKAGIVHGLGRVGDFHGLAHCPLRIANGSSAVNFGMVYSSQSLLSASIRRPSGIAGPVPSPDGLQAGQGIPAVAGAVAQPWLVGKGLDAALMVRDL
jgi:hypothetical protein